MTPKQFILLTTGSFWLYLATLPSPANPVANGAWSLVVPLILIWWWPVALLWAGNREAGTHLALVAAAWTVLPLGFGLLPWLVEHLIKWRRIG